MKRCSLDSNPFLLFFYLLSLGSCFSCGDPLSLDQGGGVLQWSHKLPDLHQKRSEQILSHFCIDIDSNVISVQRYPKASGHNYVLFTLDMLVEEMKLNRFYLLSGVSLTTSGPTVGVSFNLKCFKRRQDSLN